MRGWSWLFVAATLVSTSAQAAPKSGPKAQAKAHLDKAAAASKDGRDEDALKELDAAYALDPQPNILLARGQLNAKLTHCDVAIQLYQQFLDTKPAQELADVASQGIDTCKAALAPPPEPTPDQTPTKVTSDELNEDSENPMLERRPKVAPPKPDRPVPDAPPPAPAGPKHWYKDPLFIGLGVSAVATVTGGVIFYTAARGYLDDSEKAPSYNEWRLFVEDAHRARRYAIMCGAGAAAFTAAAVVYYVEKYAGHDEPAVTVTPKAGGAVVGWTGSF